MIERHPCFAPAAALAALAGLALAGCASEPAPPRVVERRVNDAPAARGAGLLREAMMSAHNRARAAAGVAPLVWDATLAASARGYAEDLAKSGRFEHSAQLRGPSPEGENLWTGTRGAYAYAEMIGHWLAERPMFKRGPAPNFSTTGRGGDVSHYTQIIWRTTSAVGCAMAGNARDDVLVCRYSPAGNVIGRDPLG